MLNAALSVTAADDSSEQRGITSNSVVVFNSDFNDHDVIWECGLRKIFKSLPQGYV